MSIKTAVVDGVATIEIARPEKKNALTQAMYTAMAEAIVAADADAAIRAATVVHALRRHNLKYGMVTMCVGTGQGAAGIFERV